MRPIVDNADDLQPVPLRCRLLGHKHRPMPPRLFKPTYAAYPFDQHFVEEECVRDGCDDTVMTLVAAPLPIEVAS